MKTTRSIKQKPYNYKNFEVFNTKMINVVWNFYDVIIVNLFKYDYNIYLSICLQTSIHLNNFYKSYDQKHNVGTTTN